MCRNEKLRLMARLSNEQLERASQVHLLPAIRAPPRKVLSLQRPRTRRKDSPESFCLQIVSAIRACGNLSLQNRQKRMLTGLGLDVGAVCIYVMGSSDTWWCHGLTFTS